MTPQLPLTLRAPPDQRFEAFVGDDAARDAVRAAARGEVADWLFLAGVEAIAGRTDDEEALFHFHNRARTGATTVLYAAIAGPAALSLALPDLRTRLAQCTRLALHPLDEPAPRGTLAQRRITVPFLRGLLAAGE